MYLVIEFFQNSNYPSLNTNNQRPVSGNDKLTTQNDDLTSLSSMSSTSSISSLTTVDNVAMLNRDFKAREAAANLALNENYVNYIASLKASNKTRSSDETVLTHPSAYSVFSAASVDTQPAVRVE